MSTVGHYRPIKAAGSKILVMLDPVEAVSAGGILLPESAREKAVTGVVRGVGPLFDKAGDVHVGVRVLLENAYVGAVVAEGGGNTLIAVEYDDVLAVFSAAE